MTDPWVPPAANADGGEIAARSRRPAGLQVTRRDALTFAGAVTVLAAVGAIAGLIWHVVAPRIGATITEIGVVPSNGESSAFIGGDMAFLLITAVVGVLVGVLGWASARGRGVTMAFAQTGGGLLGAFIAAIVGHAVDASNIAHWAHNAAVGSHHDWYLDLRATAILFVWPFLAVFVHLVLTMVFAPPEPPAAADHRPAGPGAGPAT